MRSSAISLGSTSSILDCLFGCSKEMAACDVLEEKRAQIAEGRKGKEAEIDELHGSFLVPKDMQSLSRQSHEGLHESSLDCCDHCTIQPLTAFPWCASQQSMCQRHFSQKPASSAVIICLQTQCIPFCRQSYLVLHGTWCIGSLGACDFSKCQARRPKPDAPMDQTSNSCSRLLQAWQNSRDSTSIPAPKFSSGC